VRGLKRTQKRKKREKVEERGRGETDERRTKWASLKALKNARDSWLGKK